MGDRLARVLTARIEELASAAERSGADPAVVGRLLESASLATMHAVSLHLLTDTDARDIWRRAEERHPLLGELREAA